MKGGAFHTLSAVLLSVFGLAGCNLAPAPPALEPVLPAHYSSDGPWRPASPADDGPRGAWWKVFGDSRLAGLLAGVATANPDLEAAAKRVEEARALARADDAALFPFLSGTGAVHRNRSSGTLANNFAGGRTRTSVRLTLDFDYELDLWGRVRNQARASSERAEAVEGDRCSAVLSLQGEMALDYYALRSQDAEIDLLIRTVALRQRTVQLAKARFKQGDTAQIDVAQAETELASTQSESIGLERRRRELLHALARLQGLVPGQFDLAPIPMDAEAQPPTIPSSVPSQLLERRPDIAAAARRVAAANAEIGVARAAWFPKISLRANGGGESSAVSLLTSAASRVWILGPDLDWPVFEAGRRRAEVEAAKARCEVAGAEYRSIVLQAVGEVEDALSALEVLRRQSMAQQATVGAAQRTVDLAQKRYDSGLVPFFEVLDAQRTLLRSQQEATRLQGERFAASVILVKALGGGWE